MTKDHILSEIRRTAEARGGTPLGARAFENETGIRFSDWYGKYWIRWGDALREAGLSPNTFQTAYDPNVLLEKVVGLIVDLGRFPVSGDFRMRARSESGFPSHNTFSKLGSKADIANLVVRYCQNRPELDAVRAICLAVSPPAATPLPAGLPESPLDGYVYLIKSGRAFKIGRTNELHRRAREIAIELPERASTVHVIRTDDPAGIEAYWHRRFESRRGNGEWFNLSASDVKAFRRRKFM